MHNLIRHIMSSSRIPGATPLPLAAPPPTTFAYPTNMAYAWFSAKQACQTGPCNEADRRACPNDEMIAAYSNYLLDSTAGNSRKNVDGIPIRAVEMGQGHTHPKAYDIVPRLMFEHPYHEERPVRWSQRRPR